MAHIFFQFFGRYAVIESSIVSFFYGVGVGIVLGLFTASLQHFLFDRD